MEDSKMGNQKNPGENSNVEHSEATTEDLEGMIYPEVSRSFEDFHRNNFFRVRECLGGN